MAGGGGVVRCSTEGRIRMDGGGRKQKKEESAREGKG
jgi:hypothetical protein